MIGLIAKTLVGEYHQVSINKVTTERHSWPDDAHCYGIFELEYSSIIGIF